MKFYDVAISLGQYCITSDALRRCHLQERSYVFDWSAGILPDKCGQGGLAGKVDLICNDFKDFFNFEDFENRGNNQENDTYNLFIVNKRTGLQYKHDFRADKGFENSFDSVKAKYMRRVNRLYTDIRNSHKILFVFIARDSDFSDSYLIEQQKKLALKFPAKEIDFLYIIHSPQMSPTEINEIQLTDNVLRVNCNVCHPTDPSYPEAWNGNTGLYYPWLQSFAYTPASLNYYRQVLFQVNDKLDILQQKNDALKKQIDILVSESLGRKKYNIFSFLKELANKFYKVKKDKKHHSVSICGIKFSVKRKKYRKGIK